MANVTLKAKLVLRNDTESNWIKANPVLIKGEMGYCTDKQYLKIGDGTKVFTMLPKNTLGKVILFDDPPTDEDAKKWEPGTIFMHIMTTPPTLYMVTWSDDLERVLQQIVTVESFDALGVMQQDKYAKSAGAGPDTGYVDKALMADKLKTARTIALTGGVGGSASFDGSGNISIATTLSITENDVPSLPLYKIRDAGTAASRNVGTTAGQVPILDASGKLNTSVLPQLAIVDVVEAASDAEMLAKTVQKGDICLRSDAPAGAFILAGNDPKELANWKRIPVPANAVLSVNGKVGVITLTTVCTLRLHASPAIYRMRTILSSWTAVTHRNNESNYHYSYAVSAAARNCGTLGRGQSDITRGRDRAGARYAAHQIWRRRYGMERPRIQHTGIIPGFSYPIRWYYCRRQRKELHR